MMFEISDHIEFLLTQHDCVVVPDLGAFITRYRSAVFSPDKQTLLPPARLIGFNPELVHNDGLLAGSLSRIKNISFEEAMLIVGQEVTAIRKRLAGGETVFSFGNLGSFSLNPEGNILFEPAKEIPFLMDAYSMLPVQLVPLSALIRKEPAVAVVKPHNPDVYYIPVSRRFIRRFTAAAAIILLLMFVSTPIDDADAPVNYAALVSSGLLDTSLQPDDVDRTLQSAEETGLRDAVALLPGNTRLPVEPSPAAEANAEKIQTPEVAAVTTPSRSGKRYYIVIASLPTREAAVKQQAHFEKLGIRGAEILDSGSKFRLYIDSFSDKHEAESFLEAVRTSSSHLQNAWLLAARS